MRVNSDGIMEEERVDGLLEIYNNSKEKKKWVDIASQSRTHMFSFFLSSFRKKKKKNEKFQTKWLHF